MAGITAWKIYKDNESNLLQTINDPNATQATIKLSLTAATGFYVSAVNALGQESIKMQVIGTPGGISAANVDYADGTPIENLKPAEIGAEKTTGKSIDILADGSTYIRSSVVAGDIVIENGNFEASASILPPPGFAIYNFTPTLSYDTSTQYSGSQSLKIIAPSSGASGVTTIRRIMCRPGDTIFASVRAKSLNGVAANLSISFRDVNFSSVGGNQVSTTSSSWTLLSTSSTAPAGTVYATFEIFAGTNGQVEFDELYARYVRNLDNEVADGSTYGRPLASRLSSGKPLIDFSESIHLNKNIDNVADGTTYARVAASQLASNLLHGFAMSDRQVRSPSSVSRSGNALIGVGGNGSGVDHTVAQWTVTFPTNPPPYVCSLSYAIVSGAPTLVHMYIQIGGTQSNMVTASSGTATIANPPSGQQTVSLVLQITGVNGDEASASTTQFQFTTQDTGNL
jgi:hypothetical protein